LDSEAKVIVTFLSAILRIADALVFSHHINDLDIKLNHKKQLMEIYIDKSINPILTNWISNKKADYFKDIFGFKIQLLNK